jgi:hypothetical protein
MNAIANFAAWAWNRAFVLVKALNRALAATPPNLGAHPYDDTVFQPRDF